MTAGMFDMFNMRDMLRSIVKGYKEKFHVPVERDVYAFEVSMQLILVLVIVFIVLFYLWSLVNRHSHSPPR